MTAAEKLAAAAGGVADEAAIAFAATVGLGPDAGGSPPLGWMVAERFDLGKAAALYRAAPAYMLERSAGPEALWRAMTERFGRGMIVQDFLDNPARRDCYALYVSVFGEAAALLRARLPATAPAPRAKPPKAEDSIFARVPGRGEKRQGADAAARLGAARRDAEAVAALQVLKGVGPAMAKRLVAAGFRSVRAVADWAGDYAGARPISGVSWAQWQDWRRHALALLAGGDGEAAAAAGGAPLSVGEAPPRPPVNRGGRGKRKA